MDSKVEHKWYAVKTYTHGMNVYYRNQNRILACFSFLVLGLTAFFYFVFLDQKTALFPGLFFLVLELFLLIMGTLIDSFEFRLQEGCLVRKSGLFPFIMVKTIPFSALLFIRLKALSRPGHSFFGGKKESMSIPKYRVELVLTRGKTLVIGEYKEKDQLVSFFEQVAPVQVEE